MAQRKSSKFPGMPPWTPARPWAAIPSSAPKRASTSPSTTRKRPARKSPTSSSTCSGGSSDPCFFRSVAAALPRFSRLGSCRTVSRLLQARGLPNGAEESPSAGRLTDETDTSGCPTIRELSRGGSNRNAQYTHFCGLRVASKHPVKGRTAGDESLCEATWLVFWGISDSCGKMESQRYASPPIHPRCDGSLHGKSRHTRPCSVRDGAGNSAQHCQIEGRDAHRR